MSHHYRETLTDIVIMVSDDGTRAAAEFTVNGAYLNADGRPPANGQRYVLPAGASCGSWRQDHAGDHLLQSGRLIARC